MEYKSVFAVANDNLKRESDYLLKNYDYYEPKLDKEFYYKYFSKELLFGVDILNIEEFLDFQYYKSSTPDLFIKLVERKILPSLRNIVSNAELDFTGGPYKDKKLENGFVESDGLIFNRDYEMYYFYHITALDHLEDDLNERFIIIENYISQIKSLGNVDNESKLLWKDKPTHIAVLIRKLIDQGYIDAPLRANGALNLTEISRIILKIFNFKNPPKVDTLRKYLDVGSEKHITTAENFESNEFLIPNAKRLG